MQVVFGLVITVVVEVQGSLVLVMGDHMGIMIAVAVTEEVEELEEVGEDNEIYEIN
tara:strand:+ start:497 stop:664 length:168 start_codon:yes stop_codon:yes gene_type:complete